MSRMTQTVPRTGRAAVRRILRWVAIAACVPYLSLKVAWIAGSTVGIPEGSALLSDGTSLRLVNAATVLMDVSVVVLALVLTKPWGRRVPSWLLALPMWGAVGLLTPIMVGFPAQLLVGALGGTASGSSGNNGAFLEGWVFHLVYGGFILQGLALGALFVLYACERWGHMWQGRLGDVGARPVGRGQRPAALVAAGLAVLPMAVHLLWACGVHTGLPDTLAAQYDADSAVQDAAYVLYTGATVAGLALLLARRAGAALALRVPLLLAGVGSAATGCWGGWLLLAAVTGPSHGDRAATPLMLLTYAVQMFVGLLVLTAGARFLNGRAGAPRTS
ncbi:hypothetical protein [Streptomyces noursei]|uniref:hypothetical protein n=1 Tax=Streptomyces noursei TaxID=1971 RepID=UPI0030EFA7F8